MLGYILELVSGKKFGDFILNNIFNSLGMVNSGYGDIGNETVGYKYKIQTSDPKQAAYINMSIPYSAGRLFSTVDDLYK